MKEKKGVESLKSEVSRLASKAKSLHERMIAIREGGKPLTTHNILEDGLGDGRLEDGFSRHVVPLDAQMQKLSDEAVGQVIGEARTKGKELRQHILDGSFPIMSGADTMREKFQDFRIEMEQTKATPHGWPEAVYEAEEIPGSPAI